MNDYYTPGKVITRKITPEESRRHKEAMKKEPWRYDADSIREYDRYRLKRKVMFNGKIGAY